MATKTQEAVSGQRSAVSGNETVKALDVASYECFCAVAALTRAAQKIDSVPGRENAARSLRTIAGLAQEWSDSFKWRAQELADL